MRHWWSLALAGLVILVILWFSSPYLHIGVSTINHGPSDERDIALTFDDGPTAEYTPQVLQILEHYGVKGTFFLVGYNVERHPEIAKQIVEQGNQIGNHSWSHSNFLPYLLPYQIADDYRKSEKAIYDATGVTPRFYRAPHGKVTPWMRWVLHKEGLMMIGWTFSPGDWRNPGTEEIINRVVNSARPGSIILLHDGLDHNQNPDRSQLIQALPAIIERLQGQGYHFVTIAQLLGMKP